MNTRIIGVHTVKASFSIVLETLHRIIGKPELRFRLSSELNSSIYLAIISHGNVLYQIISGIDNSVICLP